jgi:hypothetical protein
MISPIETINALAGRPSVTDAALALIDAGEMLREARALDYHAKLARWRAANRAMRDACAEVRS